MAPEQERATAALRLLDVSLWSEPAGPDSQLAMNPRRRTRPAEGEAESGLVRPARRRLRYMLSLALVLALTAGCHLSSSLMGPRLVNWLFHWKLPTSTQFPDDQQDGRFLLGVGKGDITGPVVEINLMGYADAKQVGRGLRQRLYSRAFIIGDINKLSDRFAYLVLDTQSGDTAVRYGILAALRALGPEYDVYDHHNIAVTGTHSHAGPGGWLNYLLPQVSSKGFDHQGYQAIIDGAVLSICRAHESLSPGFLTVGATKVYGANINRSLFAYLTNPQEERDRYNASSEDDGSVEKDLTLLKFQRAHDQKNIGVLTWFPTHGTSLLGNNSLVAADNKGVAAKLFENSVRGDETASDNFVAGFSQANVGDTSPNVMGAWCEDGSGRMCSFENSTCSDGKSQACHGRGPFYGLDDSGAASCLEIGQRQFKAAKDLYNRLLRGGERIRGRPVKSVHTFHDMAGFKFVLPNGTQAVTCPAALGYSFAAGTSDGPGVFDFTQHNGSEDTTSPVWRVVSRLLKAPTDRQRSCHGTKPILLDVGEMSTPYQWTPNIVDVQIFRAGQFMIIVSPGEATTMAGRRWKEAVYTAATSMLHGEAEEERTSLATPIVVIGGPANTYGHYITTEEEYAIQRYEGASTLYGPHTLAGYINVTLSNMQYLSARAGSRPRHSDGPLPPDNSNRSLSFITGVVRDAPPLFKSFGDVLADVRDYYPRSGLVRAKFVGANPRNNLRLEDTYAAVEKLDMEAEGNNNWKRVRDDSDWSLVFHWTRLSDILATSEVEIVWETEKSAEPGTYRLRYFGDAKSATGTIHSFNGTSGSFALA